MKRVPKVFVVVLNFNGRDVILPCLRSVFSLNYRNFEVVVVDNASRDGSAEIAKKSFSRAHFILNEENVGFAAGMNVGIRFALAKGADYVWILNNDVVVGRDALGELVLEGEKRPKALFSPLVLSPMGTTWFSSGEIDYLRMRAVHRDSKRKTRENTSYESEYLTGCALFAPKTTFTEVGLFDDKFFLYYEDVDFSCRAKKQGYGLFVVPKAVVVHSEQSEAGMEKVYWLVRSGLLFFERHTPLFIRPWMKLYILLRKVKNTIDKQFGKEEAFLVSRAYEDYRLSKKS